MNNKTKHLGILLLLLLCFWAPDECKFTFSLALFFLISKCSTNFLLPVANFVFLILFVIGAQQVVAYSGL